MGLRYVGGGHGESVRSEKTDYRKNPPRKQEQFRHFLENAPNIESKLIRLGFLCCSNHLHSA